mmetsp:Transcript_87150/g.188699  ORF Transcript_87150/g.188699 Transcript_87150/m.188699 type:complete len:222 (-) Transcript_87150:59-724(-)
MALLRALQACGHSLRETVGFKLKPAGLVITGSKARITRHKHGAAASSSWGAICAQACEDEAVGGEGPRWSLLGSGRAGMERPAFLPSTAEALLPKAAKLLALPPARPADPNSRPARSVLARSARKLLHQYELPMAKHPEVAADKPGSLAPVEDGARGTAASLQLLPPQEPSSSAVLQAAAAPRCSSAVLQAAAAAVPQVLQAAAKAPRRRLKNLTSVECDD